MLIWNVHFNPQKILGFGYKGLVFCRNNGWLMENMDKGLTVPKWVLINQPKIPPNAPKFIFPNCLPKPKNFVFWWKKASLGVCSPWLAPPCNRMKSFLNLNLTFLCTYNTIQWYDNDKIISTLLTIIHKGGHYLFSVRWVRNNLFSLRRIIDLDFDLHMVISADYGHPMRHKS